MQQSVLLYARRSRDDDLFKVDLQLSFSIFAKKTSTKSIILRTSENRPRPTLDVKSQISTLENKKYNEEMSEVDIRRENISNFLDSHRTVVMEKELEAEDLRKKLEDITMNKESATKECNEKIEQII